MPLGPFSTYAQPGAYTRTLTEPNVANLVAGLRLPVVIGVGEQELVQEDLELVRGSSTTLDQQIVAEDISESWIVDESNPSNPILGTQNGARVKFKVKNGPIVDGQGFGRVASDTRSVTVTVNGVPVALGSVQGAKGYVILQVPTQPTDVVRCTYFFHRGDTAFLDDVSDQVTATAATLVSPGVETYQITAGTSDTFKMLVNGVEKSVVFLAALAATAAQLKSQIDAAAISGLTTSVFTDNQGLKHLQLSASVSLEILDGNANGVLGWTAGTKTARNASFRVYNLPIVDGSSGGITTTDPSKVTVKVNGVQVLASAVDGKNGLVTLAAPPAAGSTVTVSYFANTWQDTFDYLPNTLVTSILRCGISPGRGDYILNQDFTISNPSDDVSIVHWGTSVDVSSVTRQNPASTAFDDTQIKPTLVDEKLYLTECARVTDTSMVPATVSSTEFNLPEVPTLGNGRDTPIGLATYNSVANTRNALDSFRPDLIIVRTGRTLRDAMNRPAAKVIAVDGRKITLKDAVPPDHKAYATFWYSRIADDTFTMTAKVAGGVGVGKYEVRSTALNANLFQVKMGAKGAGLTETVNWPRGNEQIPDAFHVGVSGATPISEEVTITFGSSPASNAIYTNKAAEPYQMYASTSATWTTAMNGTNVTTTLSGAAKGYLVGAHVAPIQSGLDVGKIAIPVSPANVLKLTIDTGSVAGVTNAQTLEVDVVLTAGNRTPAQIIGEINAAVDAALDAELGGSNTSNCAAFSLVGAASNADVIFYLKSFSTPASLPGGFDAVSYVEVRDGTVEELLGLAAYQRGTGTTGAIAKPATLLGTKTGPFTFVAGVNDTFKFRMNGVDYTVTIPVTDTSASDVVTTINAVAASVASVATLGNLGKLRLMSTTNNPSSSLLILDGNANTTLGFAEDQLAVQTGVLASEIANKLMATGAFVAEGVAYATEIDGSTYLTIESTEVGAAASSVAFVDSNALNASTLIGITPGVDGDNGEDAQDNFTVSSSQADGSSGLGTPGQTYTDEFTGLRFTILPATDGSYTSGGTLKLVVSQTFDVSPSIPTYAIPGCETLVYNTVGVGVNDTAQVQTFNPDGQEPKNGDFYFISYRYLKRDFSTRIFRQFKTIEANYGKASPENRVTLAALLAIQNGAVLVGIKQVFKVDSTNQASTQDYLTAINELAQPLPGNVKPDIVVPLATDTGVYSFLTQHCEVQSNIRNQGERMGFIGFASGTSPSSAQSIAKSLNSNRILAFYPDSAVVTFQNELGESFESPVDGSFLAAAVAGAACSPAIDVATPYTRRRINGISRLIRTLDAVEANQTATAGITLLEETASTIRIRQGLTTKMDSILTRLPTVTQISDHVQIQSRGVLDTFAGTKFLLSRTNEVEVALTGLFKALVQQEIVAAWTGIAASVDPADQTVMRAEAYYQPIFPLLYLVLTFNLRSRI